jgi:magnesium chelatase subunit D
MRAELCVVRVGSESAANELRADRVMARNVLVPSVAAALDERPGRATPLADGLALAFRTIRQTLGHGRNTMRKATLIVVTDGRANVPLDVSREGRWLGRVGRQGIDDARQVARQLRDLPRVRRVLIHPKTDALRDLPMALAAALEAEVVQVSYANA